MSIPSGEMEEEPELLHELLTSLKLPWLRLLVARTLLDQYDDSLLGPSDTATGTAQLTLRLIVSNVCFSCHIFFYFFFYWTILTYIKEGVWLRNIRAAPMCNHFTVVTPESRIREPVLFLTWPFSAWGESNAPSIVVMRTWVWILQMKVGNNDYTKTSLLLELHIYLQPLQKYLYHKWSLFPWTIS